MTPRKPRTPAPPTPAARALATLGIIDRDTDDRVFVGDSVYAELARALDEIYGRLPPLPVADDDAP